MKRTLTCVLVVMLSACAGIRPEAPAAAAVDAPAAWRITQPGTRQPPAEWWQEFGDPVLSHIVEQALSSNVDIAIAAERVAEARASFGAARSRLLPNVDLAAGGRRERFLDAFGQATSQTAERADVAISYDLDLFGRLRDSTGSARALLLASEAASENVKLAVASSAAAGYIGLRALDARLAVVRDTLAARAESLRLAKRRADSGYASRLELEQADAEYHATGQMIPSLELAIARQENGLSVLLGENPRGIERGVALSDLVAPVAPGLLPAALLGRRPDIAEATQLIAAADRSLDVARADFLPRIQLGASGGYVDSTLIGDPVGLFSLAGGVLAPLYAGGRLRAQADVAAARRDQAAWSYRRTVLNAFREVEDALATSQRTREQELELSQQRGALERSLQQAANRYRAGYSSYLEQLDAQRGLLSADLALVQARSDHLGAAVTLYRALGGGWR